MNVTLREQLKLDGISGDTGILVHWGGTDMKVCPRYLEGGWDYVLDRECYQHIGREYWV